MRDSRLRVAIAGDDAAHALLATWLADQATRVRIRAEHRTWPEVDALDEARVWVGEEALQGDDPPEQGIPFFRTSRATELLRRRSAPSGRPFYRSPRRNSAPAIEFRPLNDTIALFALAEEPPDVLLILIDEDGHPERVRMVAERVQELRQVGSSTDMTVLAGVTVPTAEAWLVAWIGPHRPEALRRIRTYLSFDPVQESHRLTSTPSTAPHHAKRVLACLLDEGQKELSHYPSGTPRWEETATALQGVRFDPASLYSSKDASRIAFYTDLFDTYPPLLFRPPT